MYCLKGITHLLTAKETDTRSEEELVATQLLFSRADSPRHKTKARLLRGKALDMRVKKSELEQKDQYVMDADVCRCECGFDHKEGPRMVSSRLARWRWALD